MDKISFRKRVGRLKTNRTKAGYKETVKKQHEYCEEKNIGKQIDKG